MLNRPGAGTARDPAASVRHAQGTADLLEPARHVDAADAAGVFVDQVLRLNEPGSVYAGGLYPLKTTPPDARSTTLVADEAA